MSNKGTIEILNKLGCKVEACGSRVTCNPAPTDTDEDYLVEVTGCDISDVVNVLAEQGFFWEGNHAEHYRNAANTFMSWRKDDLNFIVTDEPGFAKNHRAATALCTRLNLINKPDRIALFQAVLYGEIWDGESEIKKPEPKLETVKSFSDDDLPW